MPGMTVTRPARPDDFPALFALFRASVHTAAAADYTPAQRDAWAPATSAQPRWGIRLSQLEIRVALRDDRLAGFCAWTPEGYLDLLYVHPDHLRQGVATRLYNETEHALRTRGVARIHTQASLTAQPFFLRQSFRLVQAQVVRIGAIDLPNAVMEKFLA